MLKRIVLGSSLALTSFLATSTASTIATPTITLTVAGQPVAVAITTKTLSPGVFEETWDTIGGGGPASGGYEFIGDAIFNTDPLVMYGVSFINATGSAVSFGLILSDPYVGGPYTDAFSTQSGSATDGGDGNIIVVPTAGAIHKASYGSDSTGATNTQFGAIVGGCNLTGVTPHVSNACGVGNLFNIAATAPATGFLVVNLGATVSAGDVYSATGTAGLDNAPEPGTCALFATGLCLIGFVRRRAK